MGDIADGLINGDFDCETGEYLGEDYGFLRTFNTPKPKYSHKTFPKGQINATKNYLKQYMKKQFMHEYCLNALKHITPKNNYENTHNWGWKKVASLVQDNWDSFVKYTKDNFN